MITRSQSTNMDKSEIESLIQTVATRVANEVTAPLATSEELKNLVASIKVLQEENEQIKRENIEQKQRIEALESQLAVGQACRFALENRQNEMEISIDDVCQ